MKKKLILLILALFTAVGAWAIDVTIGPSTGTYHKGWSFAALSSGDWGAYWKSSYRTGSTPNDLLRFNGETGMNTTNGDIYSNQTYTLTAATGWVIASYSINGTASGDDITITPYGESGTTVTNGSSLGTSLSVTVDANSTTFELSSTGDAHFTDLSIVVTLSNSNDALVAGKSFTLQCKRGYVYFNSTQLAGTGTVGDASEFAFVKYEGNTYLYDVTQSKFVCHSTAARASTTGNAALESNSDFSKIAKGFTLGSTGIDAYPYYVEETQFANWLNMDGTPNVYLNTWTNFESGNGGNTYKIAIIDDSFDDTDAIAMLDDYFHPTTTVTYVISDASGVIFTSEAIPATGGETISALPSDYQRPYCTYSVTSTTVVAGTNTNVPVTLTAYAPPFTVSSSFATATWYYATLRGSKYLRADESHKDGSGRYQTNTTNERTDVYKWAFVGNPYELTIVNKNAGDSKVLYAGDVPVMKSATPASDNKARWIVSSNSNGGFNVRSESGASLYINDAGGGGNLGYWNSSWASSDNGSNWVISEVSASDKALLGSTLTTANSLYTTLNPGADKLGYPTATALSTFNTAIDTAQDVYDDEDGDYGSASATLTAAIATLKASIIYTPSTDVYYTIVNARGAMVYDSSHDESVDTSNGNAKYVWYGSTTPDATDVNNLWGFIEQDGNYYMYNVGKQQFATVGNGTYGSTWIFSDIPAYITLDDGIADEIAAPKVRIRATIATTSSTYTMSVSTSYTGPVITYDANGDGGVPMLFAESAIAVDDDVTDIMVSKVTDLTPYQGALKDVIDACAAIPTGTGLNEYTETSAYTTALAAAVSVYADGDATKGELQTATSDLESAMEGLSINLPGTGFYRIKGKTSNKYLAAGLAANDKFAMTDATNATTIFYYDGTKLTNLSSGMCNGATSSAWAWVVGASACTVTFQDGKAFRGYAIQSSDINFYDNGDGTSSADRGKDVSLSSSTNARYCSWELTEITTLPVTISSAGYATLYSPVALEIPSGITAYIASDEGDYLHLTAIDGSVIPAETGVILAGDAGTYDFDITTGGSVDSNALTGSVVAISRPENSYILATGTSGVGFYKDGASTIPGFKAYLPDGSGSVKMFRFDDDETGINMVNGEGVVVNGSIYNLAGQRMNRMQKGINIVNGKKVLY
ncbi:MAG: hypothetical protein J6W52_03355 [Bacteroidaceae bacterium]|nr:hypothetical protein [Bacteroidaceae bacterium]